MNNFNESPIKGFKFKMEFRKHQKIVFEKFDQVMKTSQNKAFKFHVVSPPGSGKTIMGIEMGLRLGNPILVVCPNTAIAGQWMDKFKLFITDEDTELKNIINTEPDNIGLINIFTYQMLSVPDNGDDSFERISENAWAESISEAQGIPHEEALFRINSMKKTNLEAYKTEISKFSRKLRKSMLNDPNFSIEEILHPNTLKIIEKLKEKGIYTVIFDECHHLQNYWALVMKEIIKKLTATCVIGLTATPPIDEDREKIECYTALLGEIDYYIPLPAVVKEGLLSPYQDLVYFCTPEKAELEYIENCHEKFKTLTELFNKSDSDFYFWIYDRIIKRKLISGETQDWTRFINSRPGFAAAGVKFLLKNNCKIPWDITITEDMYEQLDFNDWLVLIEDYSLNLLKLSNKEEDKALYDSIRDALKSLGYVLSEKGIRSNSSPLDRILAYSKSKTEAVKEILKTELKFMGDKIRTAIITDFEISNALTVKKAASLMDEECGGAVAVMKALVSDSSTDILDPVMITAKRLVVDDDLAEKFVNSGLKWAKDNNLKINLELSKDEFAGFISVIGSGPDWGSRTSVMMTTSLFEQGITKCIIGTRGLLSEGWDSLNLNTLIDLTVVTTYASVNQLKGRSLRKNPTDLHKLANNWDVICIAPKLEKGYNDLERLYRKHEQYYGICDDGQIQKGIDHLEPSIERQNGLLDLDDLKLINRKMLEMSQKRDYIYNMWRIGEPFENIELGCCEVNLKKPFKMKPASVLGSETRVISNKLKNCAGKTAISALSIATASAVTVFSIPAALALFGTAGFMSFISYKSIKELLKYGNENLFKLAAQTAVSDMAKCLLNAMLECEIIDPEIKEENIAVTSRSDGTIRAYLDGHEEASQIFSASLGQMFSPIENQRYAIQRHEVNVPDKLPGKFLQIIKYSINKCDPVLSFYQPLPDTFNTKEKALIFKKYWNKYVSPGDIIFLKGENGKEIIEAYGRVNFYGSKRKYLKIWK